MTRAMTNGYEGKTVVLGVTGGIAAYKSVELVSRLRKRGITVHVIETANATEFVSPLTFSTMSGQPCISDTFERPETWNVKHVSLAQAADLFVIAPATANILAKLAMGLADDMLSTTVLATKAPVLVAPAMNTGMWTNAATQANMSILKERGIHVIGPDGGFLACGDTGAGRMSEPAAIEEAILALLAPTRDMEGLRVLVTAGATREHLDPVRFLSNESSGKMGFAIADAAMKRGAEVLLVRGITSAEKPGVTREISVESTQELYDAVTSHCTECDIVIQAAAPCDYRFSKVYDQKLKKMEGTSNLVIEMIENPDIAAEVGRRKQEGQTLVGFAAETEHVTEHAMNKLAKKNLDLIVANDVTMPGAGFNTDTNIVTFITASGMKAMEKMTKHDLAYLILDEILKIRGVDVSGTIR